MPGNAGAFPKSGRGCRGGRSLFPPQLSGHLTFDPRHQDADDIRLLRLRQRTPRRNAVPFAQAAPAAAPRGVLRHENRVAPHRGLASVVRRKGRGQAPMHEIRSMAPDRRKALLRHIRPLRRPQSEAAPELRAGKPRKQRLQITSRRRGGSRSSGLLRGGGSALRLRSRLRSVFTLRSRFCREEFGVRRRDRPFRSGMSPRSGHYSTKRTFDSSRGLASGASSG